jgi:hypothetical protein
MQQELHHTILLRISSIAGSIPRKKLLNRSDTPYLHNGNTSCRADVQVTV